MGQVISKQELQDYIEKVYEQVRKRHKLFSRGFITEEECEKEIEEIFFQGFYGFLENKGIKIEDLYEKWECFFELMEAFCIPKEYFQPIPEQIQCPKFSWPEVDDMIIFFEVVDDDGLFDDVAPEGKTFHLKGKNHLGATIMITDKEKNTVGYPYLEELKYMGEGWIEGYTSITPQKIRVERYLGDSVEIRFVVKGRDEDRKLMREFPLWREYWEIIDKRKQLENKIIKQFEKKVGDCTR